MNYKLLYVRFINIYKEATKKKYKLKLSNVDKNDT